MLFMLLFRFNPKKLLSIIFSFFLQDKKISRTNWANHECRGWVDFHNGRKEIVDKATNSDGVSGFLLCSTEIYLNCIHANNFICHMITCYALFCCLVNFMLYSQEIKCCSHCIVAVLYWDSIMQSALFRLALLDSSWSKHFLVKWTG